MVVSLGLLLFLTPAQLGQAQDEPWYLSGGINPSAVIGAWQARDAASLADSYINLNDPGVNNLFASLCVEPDWTAETGWSFNGVDQCLRAAGEKLYPGYGIIVLFKNSTTDEPILGWEHPNGVGVYMRNNTDQIEAKYFNTDLNYTGDLVGADVVAIGQVSGDNLYHLYHNAIEQENFEDADDTGQVVFLGAINEPGNGSEYGQVDILALAIYDVSLTDMQWRAVSSALMVMGSDFESFEFPPEYYFSIEEIEEISTAPYYTWEEITGTLTNTLMIPIDYTLVTSYALTAYDFFANTSKVLYIIPFVLGMKMLHWLYNYVTKLRAPRHVFELDLSEIPIDEDD